MWEETWDKKSCSSKCFTQIIYIYTWLALNATSGIMYATEVAVYKVRNQSFIFQ